MNSLNRFADPVYCVMRLLVGLMFACHGAQKVLGWFPPPGQAPHSPDTMMLVGGWIEVVGGLLVAVGLLTQIAAFICSGQMAVAFFMVHAKGGLIPIVNHGELAVLYCWIFLFIFFYGSGLISIDAIIAESRGVGGESMTTDTTGRLEVLTPVIRNLAIGSSVALIVSFLLPWIQILGFGASGYNLSQLGSYGNLAWVVPIVGILALIVSFSSAIGRRAKSATFLAGGLLICAGMIYTLVRVSEGAGEGMWHAIGIGVYAAFASAIVLLCSGLAAANVAKLRQ